jgi:hypothetical protein
LIASISWSNVFEDDYVYQTYWYEILRIIQSFKAIRVTNSDGFILLQSGQGAVCRHVKNTVIKRVCKGVWLNPLSRYANNDDRLEELALLLRSDHYNYVSMETVLSQASIISQQMFGYLTVMTSGSSKTIKTTFGTLEFIHTKRDWIELSRHSIHDGHKLPWANIATAYRDLKRSGCNVKMIDLDMLKLFMDKNVEEIDD